MATQFVMDLGNGFRLLGNRSRWQVVGPDDTAKDISADEATVLRALAALGLPSDEQHVLERARKLTRGKFKGTRQYVRALLTDLHEGLIVFYPTVQHTGLVHELRGRWALPATDYDISQAPDKVQLGPGLHYSPYFRLLGSWRGITSLTPMQARVLGELLRRDAKGLFTSNATLASSLGLSPSAFEAHSRKIGEYLKAHEHSGFPDPQKRETKYVDVAFGKLFEAAVKRILEENTPWKATKDNTGSFANMAIDYDGKLHTRQIKPGDALVDPDDLKIKLKQISSANGGSVAPVGVEVEYRDFATPEDIDAYVRALQTGGNTLNLRERKYPYFAKEPDNQLFVALAVLTEEQKAVLRSYLPTEEEFLEAEARKDFRAVQRKFLNVSIPKAMAYINEIERESDGRYGLVKGLLHIGGADLLSLARMGRPPRAPGENPLKTKIYLPPEAARRFGRTLIAHFTPEQFNQLGTAMLMKTGEVVEHDRLLPFEARPLTAENVMEIFHQLDRTLNGQLDPAGVPYGFGGIDSFDRSHSGKVVASLGHEEASDRVSLQDRVLDALFSKFKAYGVQAYAEGRAGPNLRILQVDVNVSQALSELGQVLTGAADIYRQLATDYPAYLKRTGRETSFAKYADFTLSEHLRRNFSPHFKGRVSDMPASHTGNARRYDIDEPLDAEGYFRRVYQAITRFENFAGQGGLAPAERASFSAAIHRAVSGTAESPGRIELHVTDPHNATELPHEFQINGIPFLLHEGVPCVALASYFGSLPGVGPPEKNVGIFDIIIHTRPTPGLSGPLQTAVIGDIDRLLADGGTAIFHADTRLLTGMMAGDAHLSNILEFQGRRFTIRDTSRDRISSIHPRSIEMQKPGGGQLVLPGLTSADLREILQIYSRQLRLAAIRLGRLHQRNLLTPEMFSSPESRSYAHTVLLAADRSAHPLPEASPADELASHIDALRRSENAPFFSTSLLFSLMRVRKAFTDLGRRLPKSNGNPLQSQFAQYRGLVKERITEYSRELLHRRLSEGMGAMSGDNRAIAPGQVWRNVTSSDGGRYLVWHPEQPRRSRL